MAVATGKADAHFKITGGKEFDWPLRWTAVLTRQDNKWLIANMHFSGNSIENPLITASQAITSWLPWAIGLAGLVLGFTIAVVTGKRRKA